MSDLQNFRSAFNGFNREDVVHYIEYLNNRHHTQAGQLNTQLDGMQQEMNQLRKEAQSYEALEAKVQELTEANAVLAGQLQESKEQCRQLQKDVDELLNEPSAPDQNLTEQLEQSGRQSAELKQRLEESEKHSAELAQRLAMSEKHSTELEQQLQMSQKHSAELGQLLEQSRMRGEELDQQLSAANEKITKSQMPAEQELEAYRRAERAERLASERVEQMYQQANGALADATCKVDDTAAKISAASSQVMDQLQELSSIFDDSKLALQEASAAMYAIRPLQEDGQAEPEHPVRNVVCKVSRRH